jgi:ATP-binding cassette subfamily F protein 3
VQSRIKELERMERIEIPKEEKAIHFKFPQPKPSGRHVVECHRVAKSYGSKQVFRDVTFTIDRGDRVALVGVNGAGKSTLIKLLAGIEPASVGEIKLGHNVEADYFAQDQYKALDPEARLLDDLTRAAPTVLSTQTELRSLLGCFLFTEDDVFKRIRVLSGGERNRYALARMLLHPSNFLLLDEPTNHLDLRAKDVLLESLEKYTGTVVFVSHDRYFIDKLATRVFEIGGGEVNVFPGNYEDYLWRKSGKEIDLTLPGQPDLVAERIVPHHARTDDHARVSPDAAPAVKTKRVNPLRLQEMKDRCREIEEQVARREAEIEGYGQESAHFKSAEESVRLAKLIEQGREEIARLMREWEETAKVVEEQEAEGVD